MISRKLSVQFLLYCFILLFLFATGCSSVEDAIDEKIGDDESSYKISGKVTLDGQPLPGVTMTLTGDASKTSTTDANGNYSFDNLEGGYYAWAPSLKDYRFEPVYRDVTQNGSGSLTGDFAATSSPGYTSVCGNGTCETGEEVGNEFGVPSCILDCK